jgi:hypothetical protein
MTAWKITLLATQWLLLSAQTTTAVDWTPPPKPIPHLLPRMLQEQQLPPKEFDHEYDGQLTVKHMIAEDIHRVCALALKPGQGPALACASAFLGTPKKCTIWMMTEEDLNRRGWSYSIVMRHEIGHCNGWHHN